MAINLELLKKHPYETGAVIIIGGIAVFYFLSKGSSSSGVSGTSSYDAALSADSTLQQANAAAAIQTNAQQVALQQASIAASVQNNQTSAAVTENQTNTLAGLVAALQGDKTSLEVTQSNNDAATLQQANQETAEQNIYTTQEAGLEDQINQAYLENADNNATSLAGLVDTLNAQGAIASQTISAATGLATQQQSDFESNVQTLIPTFGKQYNSALDANNAASEIQTVLANGNPSVATAGTVSSATTAQAGDAATASVLSGITKLGQSVAAGIFG